MARPMVRTPTAREMTGMLAGSAASSVRAVFMFIISRWPVMS